MRRVGLALVLACLLARCLFPSLDGLSGGGDASVPDVLSEPTSDATADEAGPIAWVQQSTTSPVPPDASATLTGAVGAGNTLVVCSAFPLEFASVQVSDALGRNWVLLGSQDAVKSGHNVCFVSIGGAGGIDTIHLTTADSALADGAPHDLEEYVFEYANVSAVDQKLVTSGVVDSGLDVNAIWNAGSITATSPNELLFAWVESNSSGHLDPSFTSRTTFDGNNVGDRILDASGTFPITGTANANWVLIAATFKGF